MADPKTYTQDEYDAMVQERDALKANRDEILKEAKRAKETLKNYDGVDPAEFQRLKTAAEEAERQRALGEGDFKALEKQLIERHAADRAGDAKKIDKLSRALERRLVDAALSEALARADADPSMLPLLQTHGRKFVRVKETDDGYEGFVADEKGGQLYADGQATPMTVDDLVGKMLKTQFPAAFRGTGSTGGGAAKSSAGGAGGVFDPATSDGRDFLRNADKIAKGEITVRT